MASRHPGQPELLWGSCHPLRLAAGSGTAQGTPVPKCLQALQHHLLLTNGVCPNSGSGRGQEPSPPCLLTSHFCLKRKLKAKKKTQSQTHSPSKPATPETNPRPLAWDFSLEGSIVINGILKAQRGPCVFGRKRLDTGHPCALLGVTPAPPRQRSRDGQGQQRSVAGSSHQKTLYDKRWLSHRTNFACPTCVLVGAQTQQVHGRRRQSCPPRGLCRTVRQGGTQNSACPPQPGRGKLL